MELLIGLLVVGGIVFALIFFGGLGAVLAKTATSQEQDRTTAPDRYASTFDGRDVATWRVRYLQSGVTAEEVIAEAARRGYRHTASTQEGGKWPDTILTFERHGHD